jgi:tRNA threonylcarbamoyladenosine biosynthesis protein TsaE
MVSVTVREENELSAVAEGVLEYLKAHPEKHIITLKGDLGAGKTAFTKALARVLGVKEDVTSPTFVIMKTYPLTAHTTFNALTHIDAYRIDDEKELVILGFSSLVDDPKTLMVVEWPERILGLIPEHALAISIMITEGSNRLITYGD